MPLTNSPNHFLSSLSPHDRDLLQPHARPLQLAQGTALYRADDVIPIVYFPNTGIMSMIVGVASGQYVEASMLGRNGVIGTGAALDGPEARARSWCTRAIRIAGKALQYALDTAIAQVASTGAVIDASALGADAVVIADEEGGLTFVPMDEALPKRPG